MIISKFAQPKSDKLNVFTFALSNNQFKNDV